MNRSMLANVGIFSLVLGLCFFAPDAFAQFGGFESRMNNLNSMLITKVLPLISVLGLVYAVILALTGDGAGKGRIIMVIGCSILGFLAPFLIKWLQGVVG